MDKLLSKAIREALLEGISDSFEIKKSLSFSEQLRLYNVIESFSDEKFDRLLELSSYRRKRGEPPRLSKVISFILKAGIAAVAGGAILITLPLPFTTEAILAATYYLFQRKNYECEIACRIGEEKRPMGDKKLCYLKCEIKSWEAVRENIKIERMACKGTPKPEKCYMRLDKVLKKIDYKILAAENKIKFRQQDIRGKI